MDLTECQRTRDHADGVESGWGERTSRSGKTVEKSPGLRVSRSWKRAAKVPIWMSAMGRFRPPSTLRCVTCRCQASKACCVSSHVQSTSESTLIAFRKYCCRSMSPRNAGGKLYERNGAGHRTFACFAVDEPGGCGPELWIVIQDIDEHARINNPGHQSVSPSRSSHIHCSVERVPRKPAAYPRMASAPGPFCRMGTGAGYAQPPAGRPRGATRPGLVQPRGDRTLHRQAHPGIRVHAGRRGLRHPQNARCLFPAVRAHRHILGTNALETGGMSVGSSGEINPPIKLENFAIVIEEVGSLQAAT